MYIAKRTENGLIIPVEKNVTTFLSICQVTNSQRDADIAQQNLEKEKREAEARAVTM
jgi:hypothetical protein